MFFSIAWRNAKRSRSENLIYFLTMVTAIATFYIVLSLGEQDVMRFLSELESDAVDRLLTKLLPTVYLLSLIHISIWLMFRPMADRAAFIRLISVVSSWMIYPSIAIFRR